MKPAPAQAPAQAQAARGPVVQTRPASAPVTAPRTTTGQVSAPAPVAAPAGGRTGRPPGRTYLPAHRKRTHEIRARITEQERATLELEARKQELTLSELVRLKLLNQSVTN